MPIPITEEDVTIILNKGLVIIDREKFEKLLKYTEDMEDTLAFTQYELQVIKMRMLGFGCS